MMPIQTPHSYIEQIVKDNRSLCNENSSLTFMNKRLRAENEKLKKLVKFAEIAFLLLAIINLTIVLVSY